MPTQYDDAGFTRQLTAMDDETLLRTLASMETSPDDYRLGAKDATRSEVARRGLSLERERAAAQGVEKEVANRSLHGAYAHDADPRETGRILEDMQPRGLSKGAGTPYCVNHSANPARHTCLRCQKSICSVCEFQIGGASLCPECVCAGPSLEERSAPLTKAVWSIVLAVVGAAALALAANPSMMQGISYASLLLGPLSVAALMGGLTLGLLSRDEARATGSPLPAVAVVANGILVGIYTVAQVLYTFFGR